MGERVPVNARLPHSPPNPRSLIQLKVGDAVETCSQYVPCDHVEKKQCSAQGDFFKLPKNKAWHEQQCTPTSSPLTVPEEPTEKVLVVVVKLVVRAVVVLHSDMLGVDNKVLKQALSSIAVWQLQYTARAEVRETDLDARFKQQLRYTTRETHALSAQPLNMLQALDSAAHWLLLNRMLVTNCPPMLARAENWNPCVVLPTYCARF
jgi:hypothetical protein